MDICSKRSLTIQLVVSSVTISTMRSVRHFLRDEQGQDLIEYTLLMAFIALASAGIFVNAGKSVKGIWGVASTQLSAANVSAS
jgi:Flp pilus assembly pilin Flp